MRNINKGGKAAVEAKVYYVESKLDEAIRSLKEASEKSEARLEADRKETAARLEADRKAAEARLEADRKESVAKLDSERAASEARLKADREEFERRFAEERKEWKSTKRWLYLNFGAVAALAVTVLLALMNGAIPG